MALVPPPLSTSVDSVARRVMGRDWSLWALVVEHWATVVGPEYAAATRPVKISFPAGKAKGARWADSRQGGGTLHVGLPRGLVMALTMMLPRIQERLTTCLGRPVIARIALEPWIGEGAPSSALRTKRLQASAMPPCRALREEERARLETALGDVQDPGLREALEGLGTAVFTARRENAPMAD